jgi:hypothetical protein
VVRADWSTKVRRRAAENIHVREARLAVGGAGCHDKHAWEVVPRRPGGVTSGLITVQVLVTSPPGAGLQLKFWLTVSKIQISLSKFGIVLVSTLSEGFPCLLNALLD